MEPALLLKIFSVVWPIISAPIVVLWQRQNKMNAQLQETFSKDETKEQIELRQRPLQEALDRNSDVCKELSTVLAALRDEMAEQRGRNGKEKSGS